MPPFKRDLETGDLPPSKRSQTLVEKHDSAFDGPTALFKSFPHNDTFREHRIVKVGAIPADDPLSETYEFAHRGNSFGLIKTSDATIEADLQIVDTASVNKAPYAANFNVGISQYPMRSMWKARDIKVNGIAVSPITNADHIVAHIRQLTTEIVEEAEDSYLMNIGYPDTPGAFDSVMNIGSAAENSTHQNAQKMTSNFGLRKRARLFNDGATVKCIDTIDTVCFNENGSDKYLPSDFDLSLTFHRNPKNKYIRGYVGTTAGANGTGGVNSADVKITNFFINLPMYKPNEQMSAAINKIMVQNQQECIFYTTQYRLVTRSLAGTSRQIYESDIFTGARPTRLYYALYTLTRYNGGYGHDGLATNADATNGAIATAEAANGGTHPLKAELPDFNYAIIRINEAIVAPELKNAKEAYIEWRRALNRLQRKMPFKYDDFLTDYGWMLFDLSVNKDSFNEVLPNSTSGTINFEMTLKADLPDAPHTNVFIGEFRNQVKIGYNSPARRVYDF